MKLLLVTDLPETVARDSAASLAVMFLRHDREVCVAYTCNKNPALADNSAQTKISEMPSNDSTNNYALLQKKDIFILDNSLDSVLSNDFQPDAVLFSDLQQPEAERHSLLQNCPEIKNGRKLNPALISSRADSKSLTLNKWKKAGIPCPDFLEFDPSDPSAFEQIKNFAANNTIDSFYLQADSLTESRETWHFTSSQLREEPGYFRHILLPSLQKQTFLAKKSCGNVYYCNDDKECAPLVWRMLYLALDNTTFTDHGFIQVAPYDSPVTAIQHGGWITRLSDIYKDLYCKQEQCFIPFEITKSDLKLMSLKVQDAINTFHKGEKERLYFAGIDLVLEKQGDQLIPVFLEINPRCGALNKIEPLNIP